MPNQIIRTKIITQGNRIIQISEIENEHHENNEPWYQIDWLYRKDNTEEFKHKILRLPKHEMNAVCAFLQGGGTYEEEK